LSPLRLYFKCTLITTSSISYDLIQPNKSQVSVCVKSSPFLAPVEDRYYEETGSNLSTKSTKKSPFFISYERDENSLVIFFFFFSYGIFIFNIRGVGQTLVKRLPSIHHYIWTRFGCKVTILVLRKAIICFIYFGKKF